MWESAGVCGNRRGMWKLAGVASQTYDIMTAVIETPRLTVQPYVGISQVAFHLQFRQVESLFERGYNKYNTTSEVER